MPPNSANPNHIHRDTVIANASIDEDGVVIGPDLNATRSPLDKKEYRHITLPNGLKCVLICDTVAMRQDVSFPHVVAQEREDKTHPFHYP